MYFYIFDAFLRDKKYERTVARIEGRLLELGIQGKSEKLTVLKSMKEVAESALKRGADTLVAVGNDHTMSKLMAIVAQKDVTLGYIPVGEGTRVADVLGIPVGPKACDTLSARITKQLDLGKANTTYFVAFLTVEPARELLIECDGGKYHIETTAGQHVITISNIGGRARSPRDGMLEAEIRREAEGNGLRKLWGHREDHVTLLPFRSMKIKSLTKSLVAYADGQTVVKTPLTVRVAAKKLHMVVGKDRSFR